MLLQISSKTPTSVMFLPSAHTARKMRLTSLCALLRSSSITVMVARRAVMWNKERGNPNNEEWSIDNTEFKASSKFR